MTEVNKGLGDEFAETSVEHEFNLTHTNGMQFKPLVDNFNEELTQLKVFDATNLLF